MNATKYRSFLFSLFLLTIIGIVLLSCSKKDSNATGKIYKGKSNGYSGEITVYVTITENKKIEVIRIEGSDKDESIGSTAIDKLTKEVIRTQTIGPDSISGATITSNGFKDALNNAVVKAGFTSLDFK